MSAVVFVISVVLAGVAAGGIVRPFGRSRVAAQWSASYRSRLFQTVRALA